MENYTFNLPVGNSGNTFEAVVDSSSIYAGSNEEYKNNIQVWIEYRAILAASQTYPVISALCALCDYASPQQQYERRLAISIENIQAIGQIQVFNTSSTASQGATFQINYSRSNPINTVEGTETGSQFPGTAVLSWTDSRTESVGGLHISANIPIFETDAEALEYIQYGDNIADAINVGGDKVSGREFNITNIWTTGTWSANGYTPGSTGGHRDVRGRIVSGEIALYPVEWIGGDKLIYNVINNASYEALEYSLDGVTWIPSQTFPFEYIYKERTNELGTFSFALTNYIDRIPIFADEETAQGYIDGDIPITDALNWPDISNEYPGADLPLDIGEPDDGTDWGDVYTENFFANTYLCPTGALREIANKLYDTASPVWEDIKKGLEMFGQSPIESVVSLTYYPLSLDSVFQQSTPTNNIWFGGYNFQNMENSVKQVVYPNGFYYCGGIDFNENNLYGKGNWKNYKACRIFVDLPYCGRYELDPAKYWGKHINVIYYIDLTTGACIACLVEGAAETTREGKCLDQFNGQIGTKLSMTLTDFSRYANAQINTLLGGGGQAISSGSNFADTGISAAASGSAAGIASSLGGAALMGGIHAAGTVYGLSMNNINKFNQTRGGSTGMLNQYANQKPTFIFIYPDTDNPSNFNKMYGTPSNYGGTVSSFTGYLEVDTIKLKMDGATESEKAKARNLLMAGIYINT